MTGAIRTEGHVARLDRIGLLTIVIRAFTAQDVVRLGLAVVLMEAERAVRLDGYLCTPGSSAGTELCCPVSAWGMAFKTVW